MDGGDWDEVCKLEKNFGHEKVQQKVLNHSFQEIFCFLNLKDSNLCSLNHINIFLSSLKLFEVFVFQQLKKLLFQIFFNN
jgi:hypothetical protein